MSNRPRQADYCETRVQKRLKIIDLPDDTVPYLGIPITLMLGLLRYYRTRLEAATETTIQEILKETDLIEIAKIRFDETTCTRVAMLATKQILESDKPVTERAKWVVHPVEFNSKLQVYQYDLENLHDLNVLLKTRYQLSFLNEMLAQRYPGIEYHPANGVLGNSVLKSMIYIPKVVVKALKIGIGAIEPPKTPLDISELTMPLPEKPIVPTSPLNTTEQEIAGLVRQITARELEIDHFALKRKIDEIMQQAIEWESFNRVISVLKTCGLIAWDGTTITLPQTEMKGNE
jgi:hypothetical protein